MFKSTLKDYQGRKLYLQAIVVVSGSLRNIIIELQHDPLIRSHLSILYDTLLEQNLVRVIEPYASVELYWIAQEVGQTLQVVEEKCVIVCWSDTVD